MKKKEELFAKDRVLLLKRLEFVQVFCMSVFPLGLFFSYKSRRKVERITQTSCSSVSCFSVPFNFDYTVYVKYVFIFSWKKDKTKID